jgi:hypothetical protein
MGFTSMPPTFIIFLTQQSGPRIFVSVQSIGKVFDFFLSY